MNQRKIRNRAWLLALAAAALAPSLQAKETGCSATDFSGSYGLTITGTILPGLPISGPFGRLGTIVADGVGNLSATTLADYNGVVVPDDFTGVYQVSDNCYLSWQSYLPTAGLSVRFEGTITADGNEILLFVADPPDQVLLGSLKKQKAGGCTAADFRGSYGLSITGSFLAGSPLAGPSGRSGTVVADGAGSASANTIVSYTGAILRETFEAPYSVTEDCRLSWQVTLPPPVSLPVKFEGRIMENGKEIMLMVTDPGQVILGSLKKQ